MPLKDEEQEITVVPSGEFRADPSRYLAGVDRQPIRIVSPSGQASLTVMGVADFDERIAPPPSAEATPSE